VGRAGKTQRHEKCHHGPNVCDHDRDHAWRPWRFGFLCLPIMLYFLNLPNQGFSSATALDVEESDRTIVRKAGEVLKLGFKEMEQWALNEEQREYFEGRKGRIKGQYVRKTDRTFTLVRFKMPCCPADATPVRVAVISPESITHIKPMQWVEVTGQIQFHKRRDRDDYVPVLQLQSRDDIQPTELDYNPYIQ
jgi:hypothetical protein